MRGIREKHSRTRGGVRWAGGSRVHRGAPCCMLEALTQRTGGCHEHARPWWYYRSHRRHYPDLYRAPATRPYLETSQYIFGKRRAPGTPPGAFFMPASCVRSGPCRACVSSILGRLESRSNSFTPIVPTHERPSARQGDGRKRDLEQVARNKGHHTLDHGMPEIAREER